MNRPMLNQFITSSSFHKTMMTTCSPKQPMTRTHQEMR